MKIGRVISRMYCKLPFLDAVLRFLNEFLLLSKRVYVIRLGQTSSLSRSLFCRVYSGIAFEWISHVLST